MSSLSDKDAQESHRSPEEIKAPPATELQELQRSISSYLSNLYHMSIFIRRKPAPYDLLLRSSNIDEEPYEIFDKRHVLKKFPRADPALIERLGRAISKRRKYFKYQEQHHQKLSQQRRPNPAISAGGESSGPGPNGEDGLSFHEKAKDVVSDIGTTNLLQPSVVDPSTTPSTLFVPNTAPLNTQSLDHRSDAGTQTSYGTVSSMRPDRPSLPPLPCSSDGSREFECPYCFNICHLRSLDPDERHKEWKRHILTDLQPYVCTFGNCSEKDALFERRSDWISHELHSHRIQWYCNAPKHRVYECQETFKTHMRDEHQDSFEESQLEELTRMVARPAVDLKFSCPLRCSDRFETLAIDELEVHLGRHLEIIATFPLPLIDPSRTLPNSTADCSIVIQGAVQHNSSDSEIIPSVDGDNPLSDIDRSCPAALLYSLQDGMRSFMRVEAESSAPIGGISSLGQENQIEDTSDWLEVESQSQFLAKLDMTKRPYTTLWTFEFPGFLRLTEGRISFLLLKGVRQYSLTRDHKNNLLVSPLSR